MRKRQGLWTRKPCQVHAQTTRREHGVLTGGPSDGAKDNGLTGHPQAFRQRALPVDQGGLRPGRDTLEGCLGVVGPTGESGVLPNTQGRARC